jgi:hypothetical protein
MIRRFLCQLPWLLLLVAVLGALFLFARQRVVSVDSDDLSFLIYARDLCGSGYRLTDWRWCDSFYWFPDQLIFLPLSLLARNPLHAYVAYTMVLFGLIVLTAVPLYARLHPGSRKLLAFTALYALLLLFLVYGQRGFVRHAMFWIGWHGGVLVPGSLFVILALWQARPGASLWVWPVIGCLAWLACLSDRLFVPQFAAPAVAGWLWLTLRRRTGFFRGLGLAASSGLACYGAILTQQALTSLGWIHTRTMPPATWAERRANLKKLVLELVPDMFDRTPFNMLILFVALTLCAGFLGAAWRHRKTEASEEEDGLARDREWMAIFYPLSVLASLLAPVWVGLPSQMETNRFFYSLVVPGALLVLGWLLQVVPRLETPRPALLTAGLVAFLLAMTAGELWPAYMSWRTQPLKLSERGEAMALRAALQRHPLHCGYAGFWETKVLELAHPDHRASQLQPDGRIFPWLTNMARYFVRSGSGQGRDIPHYDYLFLSQRTPISLWTVPWWERFGPPADIVDQGADKILVYDRPADVGFRNFTRLPALLEAKRPLPLSATIPALRVYKAPGTPANTADCVPLTIGTRLQIPLEGVVPVAGQVLEISLDFGDEYRLTFLHGGREVGQTLVRSIAPRLVPGLHPFFLLLEDQVASDFVDSVVVEPLQGDGTFAIGHLFVYPDSCPTPRERRLIGQR